MIHASPTTNTAHSLSNPAIRKPLGNVEETTKNVYYYTEMYFFKMYFVAAWRVRLFKSIINYEAIRFEAMRLHWPLLDLEVSSIAGISRGADGSLTQNRSRRSKLTKIHFEFQHGVLVP